MDEDGWKTVNYTKPKATKRRTVDEPPRRPVKIPTVRLAKAKPNQEGYRLHKLETESENFRVEKVSHNLSQTIQQTRASKGWSRKEFAQRLNVKESIVADYETGKAIPNNTIMQKMSRVLGVTLRK